MLIKNSARQLKKSWPKHRWILIITTFCGVYLLIVFYLMIQMLNYHPSQSVQSQDTSVGFRCAGGSADCEKSYSTLPLHHHHPHCTQKNGNSTIITGAAIDLGFVISMLVQERKQLLFTALNSLFYFRTCPLNFRLALDEQTQEVFDEFIRRTRNDAPELLENVTFTSYDTATVIKTTANLRTGYNYRAALYKTSPEIIFIDVMEIMILDFDVIIVDDICILFERHMKQVRDSPQAIMGLAPEFSSLYDPTKTDRPGYSQFGMTPSNTTEIYRNWAGDKWSGFNAGAYVCHLQRMRQNGWTEYWTKLLTLKPWSRIKKNILELPEQNMFVLASRLNPSWFITLTPTLNFQLMYIDRGIVLDARVLAKHFQDVVILHGNAKFFHFTTPFSKLWFLFASHDLARLHSNVRPDSFYDPQFVCDERHKASSYVLDAAMGSLATLE